MKEFSPTPNYANYRHYITSSVREDRVNCLFQWNIHRISLDLDLVELSVAWEKQDCYRRKPSTEMKLKRDDWNGNEIFGNWEQNSESTTQAKLVQDSRNSRHRFG